MMTEKKGQNPDRKKEMPATKAPNGAYMDLERLPSPINNFEWKKDKIRIGGKDYPIGIIEKPTLIHGGIIDNLYRIAIEIQKAGFRHFYIDATESIKLKPKWESLASRFRSLYRREDAKSHTNFYDKDMKIRGMKINGKYILQFLFP